jgi:hypothetical protein
MRPTLPSQAATYSPPPFEPPTELSDSQWQILCGLWTNPPRNPQDAAGHLAGIYPNLRGHALEPVARLWSACFGNAWAASCFWLLVALQPRDHYSALAILMQRQNDSPGFARAIAVTMYQQLFIRPDPTKELPWELVNRSDRG